MFTFNASLISVGFECFTFGVALFYYKKLSDRYLPLIILLGTGFINDILSIVLVYNRITSNVNSNIYVLLDLGVVLWLFTRLSGKTKVRLPYYVFLIGSVLWCIDNVFLNSLFSNNSIYRLGASATIVLISLDKLGDLTLFNGPDRVLRTDVLILCGFLFYYSFKTFIECYHVFGMQLSKGFYIHIWNILSVLRILSYILFLLAILWAPKRKQFISHL